MGYINTIKRNDDIYVWERNNGKREIIKYKAPYYFYTKSNTGAYTSMYGEKLERHDFKTGKAFNLEKANLKSMGIELFESDIAADLKLLSANYYGKKAPKLHVTFYDIEINYDNEIGYSTIENPYAPINSVSLYNVWQKRMVLYAVPPKEYTGTQTEKEILNKLNLIAKLPTDCTVEIILCKDEKELLLNFLVDIEDSDVLSGWNSQYLDDPYTAKRLEKINKRLLQKLSFPEGRTPRFKEEKTKYGSMKTIVEFSGRIQADYLLIFKKYEVVERPSFKLEAISDEILIDDAGEPILPKLEYEGSLADLYRTNFLKFIRYNLRDTEILKGFEERLGYIELANQMYHLSTGKFKQVTGTVKLAELATINYCHHELDNVIVNDMHVPDDAPKAKGAFVLIPQRGEHNWLGSIDINSLYPSVIRSINISPETIIGQFTLEENAFEEIKSASFQKLTLEFEDGNERTAMAYEWKDTLKEKKWGVSAFGTVFNLDKQGIMPAILEYWYATRQEYQKLKSEAHENNDKTKEIYYDKLQYIYKIKLNSYYGSLLNAYFRFYDKRLGESVTGTSRHILLHQCAKVVEILDGKYILPDNKETDAKTGKTHIGYTKKWSMLYGDTDSSLFLTHANNQEEATEVADLVGERVSATFPKFMQDTFFCTKGFDDIIKTGREVISDKSILIDKKRYILHIVDNEGVKCDKMKIMGVDTKKTTLPKEVSKKLNSFIERYLKGEKWDTIAQDIVDYKEVLINTNDVMLIGLPRGIQNLEKYTREYEIDRNTKLPGHVAAAIHYNKCLKIYNDKESDKITSGMKIKVFYLKQPIGKFKSIAIPVDIEQVPHWFLDEFPINKNMHIERLIDNPMNNIIKALQKVTPTKQSLFTDSILDF